MISHVMSVAGLATRERAILFYMYCELLSTVDSKIDGNRRDRSAGNDGR